MSDVGDLLAGRYRLRRRLGSGAMGVVWEAMDERLQRPVAVKQLLAQPGLDPARAEENGQRAMREGRIAARLRHPNAIAVHDVASDGGLPLLVMEYFPAPSLAERLATRGPLSPHEAAHVGTQVAAALAEAHRVGIVHRDVKPANVLIADDGTVKIVDFGIAHAHGDVALTQAGVIAGTPAYLAPEVARGQPPAPASDVFSLGATLYAAVEGAPPFGEDEQNTLAVLYRVAGGAVPPPRRAGPLTPVLEAMLTTDPGRRWTAEQVRDATRAVAAGDDIAGQTVPMAAVTAAPAVTPRPGGPGGTRLDMHPVGPPTDTASNTAPVPPMPPQASPQSRRRPGRGVLAVAGGLAVVVAAGGLILTQGSTNSDNANGTPTPPPARTTTTRPLVPAEMERIVADFYTALPSRPDAAWALLGPELRVDGREAFAAQWAKVTTVTVVSTPRTTGPDTVHVGVELTRRDGTTITEFHQYSVIRLDGTVLLGSDLLLHSKRSTPPPPEKKPDKKKDKKKDENKKDKEKDGKKDDEKEGKKDKKNKDDKDD